MTEGDSKGDGIVSLLIEAHLRLLDLAGAVNVKINPNLNGLPGGDAAEKLLNGGAGFGLLAAVAVFILGAAQWGWGTNHNNYAQAVEGKGRMLKGAAGAFAVGAAAAVINFFYSAGTGVTP